MIYITIEDAMTINIMSTHIRISDDYIFDWDPLLKVGHAVSKDDAIISFLKEKL